MSPIALSRIYFRPCKSRGAITNSTAFRQTHRRLAPASAPAYMPEMARRGQSQERIVVLDFDGTITLRDIGHSICARFVGDEVRAPIARWIKGELSLGEAQA